jgi:hypothetical protein
MGFTEGAGASAFPKAHAWPWVSLRRRGASPAAQRPAERWRRPSQTWQRARSRHNAMSSYQLSNQLRGQTADIRANSKPANEPRSKPPCRSFVFNRPPKSRAQMPLYPGPRALRRTTESPSEYFRVAYRPPGELRQGNSKQNQRRRMGPFPVSPALGSRDTKTHGSLWSIFG